MQKFIPVKITDKRWAEKLQDGEIFMRPLHDFGSWGRAENRGDEKLDNDYRGDIHEGTAAVFADINDCDFGAGLDPEFKKIAKQVAYIDEDDCQYFKILSLYCMEYDAKCDFFHKPDIRMRNFGDTAVIIVDMCEFVERIGKALFAKYEHFVCLMDRVTFFDFNQTRPTNCMFEKQLGYAYQNELRIALGQLEINKFAVGPGADTSMNLVRDLAPILLQIGDIRDITCALKVDDFLALHFPPVTRFRWPVSSDRENSTNFDTLVQNTRKQMKYYQSHMVRPMITIL